MGEASRGEEGAGVGCRSISAWSSYTKDFRGGRTQDHVLYVLDVGKGFALLADVFGGHGGRGLGLG